MTTAAKSRIPAAMRVTRVLEERIGRGEYEVGSWLPTERELAEEFRVDRSVVRAALAQLERNARILREPGCRPRVADRKAAEPTPPPNTASPALPSGAIATIIPYHPLYPTGHTALLKGVHEALRLQGSVSPRLLAFDSQHRDGHSSIELERQALTAALSDGVQGVILWPKSEDSSREEVQRLREAGRFVVYLDRFPDNEPCDFVGVDNRLAARSAVEYLLRLGHTRIAHLTNTDAVRPVAERAAGYQEALQRAGITPDPALTATVRAAVHLDVSSAVDQFQALAEPPTAIFAMNDTLAHSFIVEAQARGWSVPDDVSVIGFDDMERFSPRPGLLTTMHQPFEEIGQRATELLLRRIEAGDSRSGAISRNGQHLLLPVPLIERATCRKVA